MLRYSCLPSSFPVIDKQVNLCRARVKVLSKMLDMRSGCGLPPKKGKLPARNVFSAVTEATKKRSRHLPPAICNTRWSAVSTSSWTAMGKYLEIAGASYTLKKLKDEIWYKWAQKSLKNGIFSLPNHHHRLLCWNFWHHYHYYTFSKINFRHVKQFPESKHLKGKASIFSACHSSVFVVPLPAAALHY